MKGNIMIENLVNKLKANDHAEEIAAIEKQIEDTIGTEAFEQFLERRRKARIRNYAIAIGTSVAVVGAVLWFTSNSSDDVEDESDNETTED
jgi:hypothetical protein